MLELKIKKGNNKLKKRALKKPQEERSIEFVLPLRFLPTSLLELRISFCIFFYFCHFYFQIITLVLSLVIINIEERVF